MLKCGDQQQNVSLFKPLLFDQQLFQSFTFTFWKVLTLQSLLFIWIASQGSLRWLVAERSFKIFVPLGAPLALHA